MKIPFALVALLFAAATIVATPTALRSGLDLSSIDRSIRPQDDLYRFVNGGWIEKADIPPDRVYRDAFTELADKTELDLRGIIEETIALGGRRTKASQQIADLYTSLMDESRIEAQGMAPIAPELKKIDAIHDGKGFAAEAGYLSAAASGGPFMETVEIDAEDPATPIVRVMQGGTFLPDRDYYLQNDARFVDTRSKYEAYLTEIFTLTGRRDPRADAQAVLQLETELARAQLTPAESRTIRRTTTKFSLQRLSIDMPGFDWQAWAKPQGIDQTPNIILAQPAFFKTFASLVETQPIAVWKAWLSARYITACAPYISKAFGDARFEFFGRVLTGQEEQRARWKRGVGLVNQYLGDAVGRLYTDRHLTPEARAEVQQITNNVLQAFRQAIADSSWIDAASKKRALGKLSTLSTKIGAPTEWRDYSSLVVKPDDLMGNIRRGERFQSDERMTRVRERTRREWLMTPQTVNAYYSPAANEIVLPAAILQPPLFDAGADAAANYGGIGAFIGHELAHGFDDELGLRRRARARLVEQYDGYSPAPGLHVSGELTLRENVGDLGGVSIAYRAYKASLQGHAAPEIDGFTGEQRFFMGWAQLWRAKIREEYLRRWLTSVAHAPPEFRANGSISNLQEFYDAFHLQPGDKLYRDPSQRVAIW